MRKRLIYTCLSIVLLVSALMPASAIAASPTSHASSNFFSSVAQVAVVDPGVVSVRPGGKYLIFQHTVGEKVAGQIVSSPKWQQVLGANILIVHESDTMLNLKTFTVSGKATGVVYLGKLDSYGNLVEVWMQGTYQALIRGKFHLDGSGTPIIYDQVFDGGRWSLSGIPGTSFEGINAEGMAFASLKWTDTPFGSTLAGPMVLTGKYN